MSNIHLALSGICLYNNSMIIGFKTQLKINQSQRLLLAKHAGTARHAWNQGLCLCKEVLNYNRINPDEKIKFPSAIDLHKWLVVSVKVANPWYYEVSKCAPQYALRALSDAFKAFFKKVKGFPKFKKRGRNDSFTLDGSIQIDHRQVKVPVIGWIKTYERLPHGVRPKSVTISTSADKWFISFKIEVEPSDSLKLVDVVGVDLGINHLATLSTGEVFDGAKSYKSSENKLSRMQWLNRRKQVGSSNCKKAQLKVAKLHRKVANIRKHTLDKITTYISKNHAVIGIENLNVRGMLSNGKLAKALADMGFYEFRRQLEYKTQLYGSKLVVVDRFYPSSKTCSSCGIKKESLSLKERIFICEHCLFECDRDLNASINLEKAARSVVSACGLDSADTSRLKQEENVSNC
ncbi:transposase [Nostoc sp. ChiQUE01b]|uniref:RNA-guided endonuclease InsQ/TnpB family protein n=1 Tax=Nostoc sp. ChiQUE01b TaxID=3075376 RepID=UPI002AD59A27|nr:transposase [Nostoc sp. ChiQUE01b]MDZ8259082.1 transposase [Nostoc sp. ChiQUE01b]